MFVPSKLFMNNTLDYLSAGPIKKALWNW
jgi:hypothetical protein